MKNHTFNRDASFIIIEQIRNSTLSRETKKNLLKQRDNFWILELGNLKPKGLNKNKVNKNKKNKKQTNDNNKQTKTAKTYNIPYFTSQVQMISGSCSE